MTSPTGITLFTSCVSTIFKPTNGLGVLEALIRICDRAGIDYHVFNHNAAFCCSTPWKSKGFLSTRRRVAAAVAADLGRAGFGPVVSDNSSCTEGLRAAVNDFHESAVFVQDAVEFLATVALPRLTVSRRFGSIALHPTCSSTRMQANQHLETVARAIAVDVDTPDSWGCCGFAGDRGMLHPELTRAASAPEAAEVNQRHFDAYASCNRTCEIGMTRATDRPYRHIAELLEEATRRTAAPQEDL